MHRKYRIVIYEMNTSFICEFKKHLVISLTLFFKIFALLTKIFFCLWRSFTLGVVTQGSFKCLL
jgi:hypothetical protein